MFNQFLKTAKSLLTFLRRHWKLEAGILVALAIGSIWLLSRWLSVPGAVYKPNLGIDKDAVAYVQAYLRSPNQGILAWLRDSGGLADLLKIRAAPAEFAELIGEIAGDDSITIDDLAKVLPLRAQLVLDLPEPGAQRPIIDHAALMITVHQHWRPINLKSQILGWFKARAGSAAAYRGRYLHGPKSGPFVTTVNNAVVLATDTIAAYKAIDSLLDHRYATRDADMMLQHTLYTIPGRHQLTFSLSNRDDFLVTLLHTVLDPAGRWLPGNPSPLRNRLRQLTNPRLDQALRQPLGVSGWADFSTESGWKGSVRIYCRTAELAVAEQPQWTGLVGALLNIRGPDGKSNLTSLTEGSLLTVNFQKKSP